MQGQYAPANCHGVMLWYLMQNTLGELNLMYCIIYLDDVGIQRKSTWSIYMLKLKPSKCSFFQSEIVYLAHHMS